MSRALAKANSTLLVDVIPPSPEMDVAARVNYYHMLSREAGGVAIRAAMAAGLELAKVQAEKPGNLFDRWIEANCSFTRRTAFRYLAVARKALEGRVDALLEGSDDERKAAIDEATDEADSKSLTELYIDLGIVKKTPSNLGGARPGAGRPKKLTLEQMAAQAAALAADPETAWRELSAAMGGVDAFVVARDGLGLLDGAKLTAFRESALAWAKRADEILEGRAKKTT